MGWSVAELMELGAQDLDHRRRASGGRATSSASLQVEGFFEDGQKLVTVHEPIAPGTEPREGVEPGEVVDRRRRHRAAAGTRDGVDPVAEHGDRPVQVGSHYHFFEVNRALRFDREARVRNASRHPGRDRGPVRAGRGARGRARRVRRAARASRTQPADRGRRSRRRRWRGRARARLQGARDGYADFAPALRANCSGRPRAIGSGWAIPSCGRRSSATSSFPATRACSAAARRCATGLAATAQSRPRTARSIS